MSRHVLAVCCACLGGAVGCVGFWLLLARGIYAVVLAGALLGLAAGIVRTHSPVVAVLSSLVAIVAGLWSEHQVAPFVADRSLGYFLRHLLDLQPLTQVSGAIGGPDRLLGPLPAPGPAHDLTPHHECARSRLVDALRHCSRAKSIFSMRR